MNKWLKIISIILPFINKESATPPPKDVKVLRLKHRNVTLPESGRFVMESHYATNLDIFANSLFPSFEKDRIAQHLARSFDILKLTVPNAKFEDVYGSRYASEWTPANDGGTNEYGQAARGNVRPFVAEEVWWGNMLFEEMPAPGTKFMLRNPINNRSCVIQMGYEVGPGNTKFLGGVSCEVQYYLKANNETSLILDKCDQSLPLGPI